MKPSMRRAACATTIATLSAMGLTLANWPTAGATDVKGSVRSEETPKQSAIEGVRAPYWQEWNGFIEPKKPAVDYAREVSVVLVGAIPMKDAVIVELSNGTLTPSTIVAQHNAPLRIRNQDDFAHKLYAEKLKQFDAIETSPGSSRELAMLQTGAFAISDQLAPHVHGYLHVLPKVSAIATPQADGTFVFKDVVPGSYTLKVFRGPHEMSTSELEVKDTREVVVDPISVENKATK